MTDLDIDCLISKLKEFDALRDTDTINQGEVDRIEPAYADEWPALLNTSVREAMVNSGIARPYQHQVDAIVKALNGADVVMESPTASGKTLAFAAPMLHVLKENPSSSNYTMLRLVKNSRSTGPALAKSHYTTASGRYWGSSRTTVPWTTLTLVQITAFLTGPD